ncbi:MAG TPA: anti-sigma factor [Blastocatellia bacterium]|jgi:anti-sigma factor RsiW
MRDNHIITRLEERSVSHLSEDERAIVEAHVAACPACARAYQAARVSDSLIRARASETMDVSPFFKTRVMAAIREKHLSPEMPALARMWKAAGTLVSMMAGLVVILIGLTIFNYSPEPEVPSTEVATSMNIYSPEYVVIDRGDLEGEPLAYDQVLGTIYDSEEDDGD